jgi:L-aminopeptidase/D-esterase-like protein
LGLFFGPLALTGTGNVSVVHQALVDWSARPGFLAHDEAVMRSLPLVGETLDEPLNDIFGHPLSEQDVFTALDKAGGGPVQEGNVGGGTGMMAYQFKGGIGTASRRATVAGRAFTVGVLLQSNHGRRQNLRIAGIPIGEEIPDLMPQNGSASATPPAAQGKNSILVIIATDAPLSSSQLTRLSRRAASAWDETAELSATCRASSRLPSPRHIAFPCRARRRSHFSSATWTKIC